MSLWRIVGTAVHLGTSNAIRSRRCLLCGWSIGRLVVRWDHNAIWKPITVTWRICYITTRRRSRNSLQWIRISRERNRAKSSWESGSKRCKAKRNSAQLACQLQVKWTLISLIRHRRPNRRQWSKISRSRPYWKNQEFYESQLFSYRGICKSKLKRRKRRG